MLRDGARDPSPPPTYSQVTKVSFGRILPFQATHVYNHLVSSSFNPPPGALFSFPSPYWCTIGLGMYLVLEVDASQIPKPKSRPGTQEHRPNSCQFAPTGLSPSTTSLSRLLRLHRRRYDQVHNTTSLTDFSARFGLNCFPFARRYSGNLG